MLQCKPRNPNEAAGACQKGNRLKNSNYHIISILHIPIGVLQGFQAEWSVFSQVTASSQTPFHRWDTPYGKGLEIRSALSKQHMLSFPLTIKPGYEILTPIISWLLSPQNHSSFPSQQHWLILCRSGTVNKTIHKSGKKVPAESRDLSPTLWIYINFWLRRTGAWCVFFLVAAPNRYNK